MGDPNRLLTLTHAMTMNNAAFASGIATFQPRNSIQSLTVALSMFQSILTPPAPPIPYSVTNVMDIEDVCMTFGEPLMSLTEDSTNKILGWNHDAKKPISAALLASGYYLFNYPVVYTYEQSPLLAASYESCHQVQVQGDSHQSRGGPIFLCALVGCTVFNLALLHHSQGLVNGDSRVLSKALKLYESANVLLQRAIDEIDRCYGEYKRIQVASGQSSSSPSFLEEGGGTRSASSMNVKNDVLVLVQMASWNNMSQIYHHQGCFQRSQLSLQNVAFLLRQTRSVGSYNQIAKEFVNQALLNIFLLRTSPQPAPAA